MPLQPNVGIFSQSQYAPDSPEEKKKGDHAITDGHTFVRQNSCAHIDIGANFGLG